MPRVSVITSLYRSEPYIEELYARCVAILNEIADDYEFVFVDDGSPDAGNEVVGKLIDCDERVRLIELSRNFGHHPALMVGLQHATGDYIFLIDSDLEEDPELLARFYEIMTSCEESPDVVYGVMEERKGGLLERLPGRVFYKILNALSEVKVAEDVIGARLMTRQYVNALLQFTEARPYLGGIMAFVGFDQVAVRCPKSSKGDTTYDLRRKVSLALDGILGFSNKPLTFVAALGLFLTICAVAATMVLLFSQTGGEPSAQAWTLVSIWLFGGLTILSLGIIGLYVGRILVQVRHRPTAIVRQIYNPSSDG